MKPIIARFTRVSIDGRVSHESMDFDTIKKAESWFELMKLALVMQPEGSLAEIKDFYIENPAQNFYGKIK